MLNDLLKKDAIAFWTYIKHYAEEDEKKEHIHLYIMPNGMIETNGVRKLLEEMDLKNPEKGLLKAQDCRSSKFDDWYLYCLHDPGYLTSKGLTRKYHYRDTDMVTSCEESLHERVSTIDYSKYRKTQDFVDAILNGVPFAQMVRRGQIPVNQFAQWKQMADFLLSIERPVFEYEAAATVEVDPETGEVLSPINKN